MKRNRNFRNMKPTGVDAVVPKATSTKKSKPIQCHKSQIGGLRVGDSSNEAYRTEVIQLLDLEDDEIEDQDAVSISTDLMIDQNELDDLGLVPTRVITKLQELGNNSSCVEEPESPKAVATIAGAQQTPVSASLKKKKTARNNKKMINHGGRQHDPIWKHFEQIICQGQKSQWKCNFCLKLVSAQAPRLKSHLKKCTVYIKEQQPVSIALSELAPAQAASVPVPVPAVSSGSNQYRHPSRQTDIALFMDKTTQSKKDLLDLKLAKFIFSANLPFHVVQNGQFKEWIQEMKCSYTPPSQDRLKGTLLDKVFDEINAELHDQLDGQEVVILQDGWSTTQNNPVIAHSVTSGVKNFFTKAVSTGTNAKTAEYCQVLLQAEIARVESEYSCQVIGCVTDNCNTMKLLRLTMAEASPHIHIYGCNSHLLNLVGQDFTPIQLKVQIVKVQNFFRNTHYASASLQSKKGLRPVVPGDTRWNSQIDCFDSFKANHAKYLEISRESGCTMPEDVKCTIADPGIYEELLRAIEILRPIASALDKLQKDQSTIADAVASWVRLEQELDSTITKSKKFQDRMIQGCLPTSIAAHMLHPKYRGFGLTVRLQEIGNQWLTTRNPYFVVAAANLNLGDTGFYPKAFMDETVSGSMSPRNWWLAVGRAHNLPKGLVELSTILMKLPSSTAGIERSFSTLGAIMSKRRCRLDIEKGSKLCFINQYYKTEGREEVYIDHDNLE